jgi:hypothetical protein
VRKTHRYCSKGTGRASFVILRNQDGAAELMQITFGTRELMATSNASAPFSMKQHSSIIRMDGWADLILSGSFPGKAINSPPSANFKLRATPKGHSRSQNNPASFRIAKKSQKGRTHRVADGYSRQSQAIIARQFKTGELVALGKLRQ